MNEIKKFLSESNRNKHLLYGALLGILPSTLWDAIVLGTAVGGAMEYKDKAYGGKFDYIDLALTLVGVICGYAVKSIF